MKYSTFKYGGGAAGAKYGTGEAVELKVWYFGVYWDDAFVDESSRLINLQTNRGRDHLLATGGNGWERFKPGEAVGTFDNSDGRFDPYDTGGPLYGFLLPGRVVRVTVAVTPPYSDTATTFNVLRGIIDDIRTSLKGGRREATIVVKDGLEWLNRRSIALALVEDAEALVTAAAIAGQVGFDDVDDWTISQLGTDSLVIPYASGNSNSAIELINEFVDAEAGQVFHGADGALYLITNDYTEAETIDIDDEQGHILRDFELKSPWEVVRTRAQIVVSPRIEGSPVVLWSLGNEGVVATWTAVDVTEFPTTPYLFGYIGVEDIAIDAIFSDPETISKTPTVDYEGVKGDPDPSTNNWVDASSEILTVTDIGNGYHLAWNFNGAGGYEWSIVTWAEITAIPIEIGDEVVVTASDSAAIAIYGEKTFVLDNPWIQEQPHAQEYANYVVNELKAAKKFPTIVIEGRGLLQYTTELYTSKVHLTIPALGIDDTFRVGKISHRWLNENGLATQTVLRLEPVLGVLE